MNARPEAQAARAGQAAPTKPAARAAPPASAFEAEIFREVQVSLSATLGETRVTVEELMGLENGSVVPLDRMLNELVELRLNDKVVARGEIVAVDDRFAVRIVEVRPAV